MTHCIILSIMIFSLLTGSEEEQDHIWAQEVVLPAEGVYDQEVADHAGDADGEDDGADGVVGVVGHVHCGERVRGFGRHRHLRTKQEMTCKSS